MTFAENINRICREQGTTLTALVKKLGLSTSKVSYWNGGSLPKEDVMLLLAKELKCSVMDFFADESDLEQQSMIDSLDDDEKEIVRIFRSFDRRAKHEFMALVYDFDKRMELAGDTSPNQSDVG
jgi:transcriptional regulator with XRE-family HTH domain